MNVMRLFLDEDVHFELASALRKRGIDAVHAQELERKGRTDIEQLNFAASQKRCLFTFNVRDFVMLHKEYMKQGKEHYGIIVSAQVKFPVALSKLLRRMQTQSLETLRNEIIFL